MPDRRLIDDLLVGAVDVLPDGALEEKLALAEREGRPLRVKLGVDPTAPDIHLGHTVVLNKLRQFQDAGHMAVLIIGDYTARIGDPSGRSKTRPRLDGAVIDANAKTYQDQAFLILDDDPAKLEVRFNGEWLAPLTMEQLFEITATTTVARILERDDFAKRWEAHQPISMLEMLYPVRPGLRLGRDRGRHRARRHRPGLQPLHGPRPAAVLRAGAAGDHDDGHPAGHRRRRAHEQVDGQLHRRHRGPARRLRQGHEHPGRGR